MISRRRLARGLLALLALGCSDDERPADDPTLHFAEIGSPSAPSGAQSFRFGAASAATQIEDQNPHTDWYVYTQPKAEGGLGNGTFVGDAAKGYTKALEDVELIAALGLDSYRFSIEWARIEPQRDQIDGAALAHYSDFIDALIARGIRPMVTVHHFSNPTWVDDPADQEDCKDGPSDANLCGFGHPIGGPLVVEEMRQHAQLLAERFGDRVDEWATVNEPVNYLVASYGIGFFPPGKSSLLSAETLLGKLVAVIRDFVSGHAAMYGALKSADLVDADGDGVAASVGLTLSVADWVPARAERSSGRRRCARSAGLRLSPPPGGCAASGPVRPGPRRRARRAPACLEGHARLARRPVLLSRGGHRTEPADPRDPGDAVLRDLGHRGRLPAAR
jgi:hypothetical protein